MRTCHFPARRPVSRSLPRSLPGSLLGCLLGLLGLAGCGAPRGTPAGAELLQDVNPGGALVVHRVYSPAFEAIETALESNDLDVARATLQQLRGRLLRDLNSVPTLADARTRDDELAQRTASGELPSRESVESALEMVDGFERVIDGRVRVEAIRLAVELRRMPDTELVEVSLVGTSAWGAPLVLRPGVGRLDTLRTSIEPHIGAERRERTQSSLERDVELELPALGRGSLVIATLPIQVPVGAIATRMRVDVTFNGGTVEDGGRVLPAREVAVASTKRTDLAGWVPASLLDPGDLVELVERGAAPLTTILEHAARISPARYEETLDRLGRAVRTLPLESFRTLVPALRWLVATDEFGRDERQWRGWLIRRYQERAAAGILSIPVEAPAADGS